MAQDATNLVALAWPADLLGEAIEAVARRCDLLGPEAQSTNLPGERETQDLDSVSQWVELVAGHLGVETEPFEASYADTERLLAGVAPALVLLPQESPEQAPRWLALSESGRRNVTLIAPDRTQHRVATQQIRQALCEPIERARRGKLDVLLAEAGVAEADRARVAATILADQLASEQVGTGWFVRMSPSASVMRQARHARLLTPLVALLAAGLVQQALSLLSWWVLGRGIFGERFESVWLSAWALLVFSGIPLQLMMARAQARFATALSTISKNRLLYGTLKLEPEEIRHQGIGQFLGRIMDADSIELLSLGGGISAIYAVSQIVAAFGLLIAGLGGFVHASFLCLWVLATLFFGWRYAVVARAWIDCYRGMTNDLVERMVGHRTRLAQEAPAAWHTEEDRSLERYQQLSEAVDRTALVLNSLPRAWMVGGLAAIAIHIVSTPASPVLLAAGLGGVMLAFQALGSIVGGAQTWVAGAQAWEQVAPVFDAATRREATASVTLPSQSSTRATSKQTPLLLAKDLSFRYRALGRSTLDRCGLQVFIGDRVLLQGPSGSGKSTLAAVLSGLRQADSGLLLLWGYDQPSLGAAAWRKRVAVAPQFHENHVFSETFAFNLLMGRQWPPTSDDLAQAEHFCRELGLGDLLARMPSGLQQMLGESGWQLSHGERSRLFIARALLQNADIMILDESFAALDPKTLALALRCVLEYAPTLLVIAHP